MSNWSTLELYVAPPAKTSCKEEKGGIQASMNLSSIALESQCVSGRSDSFYSLRNMTWSTWLLAKKTGAVFKKGQLSIKPCRRVSI